MAIKLLKVGNSFNVPQKNYICDTETERDNLNAYFGDLCLVIETGLTYILNSSNEWMVYATGSGGGADTTLIAPDYDETESYSVGDLVVYDGTLYRATANSSGGPFDENDWTETDVSQTKADLINGKVPASQLPSYVDDVVEGYYHDGVFYSDSTFETPITGEASKIYVDLLTNSSYRWSGTVYVQVGSAEEIPQSDWNQGDDTQLDYIKNKPFYDIVEIPNGWDGDWDDPNAPETIIIYGK